MFKQFYFVKKCLLTILTFSSFYISNCYPSHFFYYPEIKTNGNQQYVLIKKILYTSKVYPELNIIKLPGAVIRYIRSKTTLSNIPIRLLIRSDKSYKYSNSLREIFSSAVALQIVINQSWTTGWTTNNTSRKTMLSSSGPCFETNPTTLSELSTNLIPLLEGLKTVTVSATELTSTLNSMIAQINALPNENGVQSIISQMTSKWIPAINSPDIGNTGDLIYGKGIFTHPMTVIYGSGTKVLTTTDTNAAINSWKNAPIELFIISSNVIDPSIMVQQAIPIIQTQAPNLSNSILPNYNSPGIATLKTAITQYATTPNGALLIFSTGIIKPASLIALEILRQHFLSISPSTVSTAIYNCDWLPTAQSGFFLVHTAANSTSSGIVSGKTITTYVDETLIVNFQNTVNLAYVESRLRSSWSDCLGETQRQNRSLDRYITDNNNNSVEGFFTWIEDWYSKETIIEDLYHIGKSITSNSSDFSELCNEVVTVFSNIRTRQLQYKYAEYNWSNLLP